MKWKSNPARRGLPIDATFRATSDISILMFVHSNHETVHPPTTFEPCQPSVDTVDSDSLAAFQQTVCDERLLSKSDSNVVQAAASHGNCCPQLEAAHSQVPGDRHPFEQECNLDVIIDQSSTRFLALTSEVQPPTKPIAEISSLRRMIPPSHVPGNQLVASLCQVCTPCTLVATFQIQFVSG